MKVAVLGGGSWGTALANVLARKGGDVTLGARREEIAWEIGERRSNSRYLPGQALSPRLRASADLAEALRGVSIAVLAVPCQSLGSFLREHRGLFPARTGFVCASKGVELETFRTMGQVVRDELAGLEPRFAVVSGPSFAT